MAATCSSCFRSILRRKTYVHPNIWDVKCRFLGLGSSRKLIVSVSVLRDRFCSVWQFTYKLIGKYVRWVTRCTCTCASAAVSRTHEASTKLLENSLKAKDLHLSDTLDTFSHKKIIERTIFSGHSRHIFLACLGIRSFTPWHLAHMFLLVKKVKWVPHATASWKRKISVTLNSFLKCLKNINLCRSNLFPEVLGTAAPTLYLLTWGTQFTTDTVPKPFGILLY